MFLAAGGIPPVFLDDDYVTEGALFGNDGAPINEQPHIIAVPYELEAWQEVPGTDMRVAVAAPDVVRDWMRDSMFNPRVYQLFGSEGPQYYLPAQRFGDYFDMAMEDVTYGRDLLLPGRSALDQIVAARMFDMWTSPRDISSFFELNPDQMRNFNVMAREVVDYIFQRINLSENIEIHQDDIARIIYQKLHPNVERAPIFLVLPEQTKAIYQNMARHAFYLLQDIAQDPASVGINPGDVGNGSASEERGSLFYEAALRSGAGLAQAASSQELRSPTQEELKSYLRFHLENYEVEVLSNFLENVSNPRTGGLRPVDLNNSSEGDLRDRRIVVITYREDQASPDPFDQRDRIISIRGLEDYMMDMYPDQIFNEMGGSPRLQAMQRELQNQSNASVQIQGQEPLIFNSYRYTITGGGRPTTPNHRYVFAEIPEGVNLEMVQVGQRSIPVLVPTREAAAEQVPIAQGARVLFAETDAQQQQAFQTAILEELLVRHNRAGRRITAIEEFLNEEQVGILRERWASISMPESLSDEMPERATLSFYAAQMQLFELELARIEAIHVDNVSLGLRDNLEVISDPNRLVELISRDPDLVNILLTELVLERMNNLAGRRLPELRDNRRSGEVVSTMARNVRNHVGRGMLLADALDVEILRAEEYNSDIFRGLDVDARGRMRRGLEEREEGRSRFMETLRTRARAVAP